MEADVVAVRDEERSSRPEMGKSSPAGERNHGFAYREGLTRSLSSRDGRRAGKAGEPMKCQQIQ
jgi:hypothetical protein